MNLQKTSKLVIYALSDTHQHHALFDLKDQCDVLIHCGDFSGSGTIAETKKFLEWFSKQPATHKIFISGNHDALDDEQPSLFNEILKEYPGVIYLRDSGCEIEGIKFWGRPWTPRFNDWNFMCDPDSPKMKSTLDIVPTDTHVLITHGPPYQILDLTNGNENVGCMDTRNWLEDGKNKPILILCGHIHHSRGTYMYGDTTIVNCAVLNDWYRFKGMPMVIEIEDKKVTSIIK